MSTPVKVTVIGAGSATFSVGLVRDLCMTEELAGSHVCFMDIDAERLEMIHLLAKRYVQELGGQLTFEKTTNREHALRDADFIVNTAAHMERDRWEEGRDLHRKYGYYSGASFGVNYYNLNLMLNIARDIERVCPDAWLIQSGNPVFEGTTLMSRETGIQVIGLCHGHYGYLRTAQILGLDPENVTWVAPGLNHVIWLNEFRYKGQDVYPRVDEWIRNEAQDYWKDREEHPDNYPVEDYMSRGVIDQYRRFGLLPVGDATRHGGWWYKTDLETRVFWHGPYGGFASDLETPPRHDRKQRAVVQVREVASDPSRSVLEAFPPTKSREQQVPIINALANDVPGRFQINVPNEGALPGVAADVVTEIPALIDKGGIHRVQVKPLPRKLMLEVILPRVLAMEWELEAFLTGDRGMLLDGLLMVSHYQSVGTTSSYQQAKGYLDEMLAQPERREMAEHFAERQPDWAHVLQR